MSEELLSALLDGECTPAEAEAVLSAIEQSPELAARWSRMCLTRDALAGVSVARPTFDFSAGVMAAITAEAMVQASPNVVPPRRQLSAVGSVAAAPARRGRRRWQPMAGLAAAASIAAVAVIGGRVLLESPVGGRAATAAATTGVLALASDRVRITADGQIIGAEAQEAAVTRWAQLDSASARELDGYLLEHANLRANAGMGGALSYARMVSTADNRSADGRR